jgi:hypothetical protein
MMIQLVLSGIVPIIAIALGVQTSAGEGLLTKVLKVIGMILSVVPIIGRLQSFAFRGTGSGYREKCGAMAIAGIVL